MIEILYALIIIIISFSAGRKILALMKWRWNSFAEEAAFSLATGFCIIAYTVFFLGIFKLLYREVFWVMLAFIGVITWKDSIYLAYRIRRSVRVRVKPKFYIALLLFLIVIAVLNFAGSLAPAYLYDTVSYHLAVPKIYLLKHGIVYRPDIMFSNWPFLINMLFMLGLGIGNGIVANLIAYSLGITAVIAVYAFASRILNKKAAIIATVLFYSAPIVVQHATHSQVDISMALFTLLALHAFYVWTENKQTKWLALSAAMIGLSAAIKQTGMLSMSALGLFVMYAALRRMGLKKAIKYGVMFGLVSLLLASPFYIKSYVHTGNPVYPWLYEYFGGKYWSDDLAGRGERSIADSYTYRGPVNFILLPWNVTMQSMKFNTLLGYGPLFLAFIPLYLFFEKKRAINQLLIYMLIFTLLWYFIVPSNSIRHLMAILGILSVVASYPIQMTLQKVPLRYVTALALAAFMAFSLVLWYGTTSKHLPVAIGLESKESFYGKLIDKNPYKACQYINQNLPDAKILMFTELRGFFCDTDYVWGNPGFQGFVAFDDMDGPEALYARLKEIGITHVMLNPGLTILHGPEQAGEKELALMNGMLDAHGSRVYQDKDIELYEVR